MKAKRRGLRIPFHHEPIMPNFATPEEKAMFTRIDKVLEWQKFKIGR
jgi:hypothetical protein